MENQVQQEFEVVRANCSVSELMVYDENDAATRVGANDVIVKNVLRYCDVATRKSCLLVNHMWRSLALKYWTLEFTYATYRQLPVIREILQNRGRLMPFKSIGLNVDVMQANWMTYSPELTNLSITSGRLSERGLYDIVFDTFYMLKKLEIIDTYLQFIPREQAVLQAVLGPVSQLQELTLLLHEDPEDSDFFSDDFCLKLFARLGNLKVLNFYGGGAERKIPLFEALTNGNVKLEQLTYFPQSNLVEASSVLNEYFQRCGEPLRHIDMTVSLLRCRDVFAEYCGENLEYLKVQVVEEDIELSFCIELEKKVLDLSKFEIDNLPNLPRLPLMPKKERRSRYKRTKPGATMEELVCKIAFPNMNYSYEVGQMDNLFKIFRGTSLLLMASTISSRNDYFLRRDELIAAGEAFPNLVHLIIDAELETWECQELMAQVVLNFRELETFIWWRDFTAPEALLLLSLPKLKTVRLRSVTISRKLYDVLNNHVANLEVLEKNFQ